MVGIWGGVILTIQIFLTAKKKFCKYWTLIKIKISMTCMYKEHNVKKLVQEHWIKLKMKFLWGYTKGGTFGEGDSTWGNSSWWRGDDQIFCWLGWTAPHLPSRENSGLCSPTIPHIFCHLFSCSFYHLFSRRNESGLFHLRFWCFCHFACLPSKSVELLVLCLHFFPTGFGFDVLVVTVALSKNYILALILFVCRFHVTYEF